MLTVVPVMSADCGAAPSFASPTFEQPRLIDATLAGGEPSIQPMRTGTLVYSSHAGTTHLRKGGDPTGFGTTYDGTINTWRSTDGGDTWAPVALVEQMTGAPLPQGFSDPSTAVDAAGNIYLSAIDTATVYTGRSTDGARFVGNKLAAFNMDREWIAADTEGVVYMNATSMYLPWPDTEPDGPLDLTSNRILWRSTDGAASWDAPFGVELPGSGSMSPIAVNPTDGSLVWPATSYSQFSGTPIEVYVWPNARQGDLKTRRTGRVNEGLPHFGGFFNPLAIDDAGTITIVSNSFSVVRAAVSTDGGRTYVTTVVHRSDRQIVWPWVSAGSDGRAVITWFERARTGLGWVINGAATTSNGGWVDACATRHPAAWQVFPVVSQPFHDGYICDQGLNCNASIGEQGDRRLGDYHTNAITPEGRIVVAYADTSHDPDAAISHPALVRQTGGMTLR